MQTCFTIYLWHTKLLSIRLELFISPKLVLKMSSIFSRNKLMIPIILFQSLQWTYNGDTGAFNSDNIGAEDVKLFLLKQFLLKQTCKLFRFLSETMDTFSLAGSVQQAQKSTHPAEGLNPL